jgi:hypothetical protein
MCSETLHIFGSPTCFVFGFMNCTTCQTCLTGGFQELMYTGYRKYHGMKFQGIVILNSLLAHFKGHFRAPQHNLGILNNSQRITRLAKFAIQPGLG